MASSGPPFVYIWFKVDQYFLKLDKTLTEFLTCPPAEEQSKTFPNMRQPSSI